MRAPWMRQIGDKIYDVTINRHQTLRSNTQCHPHRLPVVHQLFSQPSKTNIYGTLCLKWIRS